MGLLACLAHPEEIVALLKFKLGGCETVMPKCDFGMMPPTRRRCYDFLKMTSRSFAAVIQALEGDLRDAVCIFYLVLRALDTLEDDMTIPVDVKVPMLKAFYTHLLESDWCFMESNEKDKMVLEEFPVIATEFQSLAPVYQTVISDICQRMGEGMTIYLDQSPGSMEEWNEYCHYVAGLVGIGLSRLFSASGMEDAVVGEDTKLANSMGLFLQKTNIIRDYLEDVLQEREFWPKEAWGKYCKKMLELSRPERRCDAVACLNELITNALHHIPDVLTYMSRLHNQSIFNFCAIPQVMAVATLERCYNNPAVFTGVVKIRKGEAVKMMMEATTMDSVKAIFSHFTTHIKERIPANDPSVTKTRAIVDRTLTLTKVEQPYVSTSAYYPLYVSCAMLMGAIVWQYWTGISNVVGTFTPS
ncbi:Squalene synthase [Lamellibrachia satsuma]|nr:Squalene synthase [Lamellibrachia satsuma]